MFDFLKNPIIKNVIRRIVTIALGALGTYLVKKNLATDSEVAKAIDELTPYVVGAVMLAYEAARARATAKAEQKVSVALNMPEGSSHEDLNAAIKKAA